MWVLKKGLFLYYLLTIVLFCIWTTISLLLSHLVVGKIGDSKKRGRPNARCIGSIKEAKGMSLQELSRVTKDRTLCTSHIHRRLGVRANSKAVNTCEEIYCIGTCIIPFTTSLNSLLPLLFLIPFFNLNTLISVPAHLTLKSQNSLYPSMNFQRSEI